MGRPFIGPLAPVVKGLHPLGHHRLANFAERPHDIEMSDDSDTIALRATVIAGHTIARYQKRRPI